MRKVMILAMAAAATACGGASGVAQSSDSPSAPTIADASPGQRDYALADFESVSVAGPHNVRVTVGPAFSVHAEGPRDTLEHTEVIVEDGTLKIRPRRERDGKRKWRDYAPATFAVSLPRLAGASLAGSGTMSVDRVVGEDFSGSIAGSGTLEIGELAVAETDLSIAGSGDLVAHGRAAHARLSIAGSGDLRARDLTSDSAAISIAGSGDAALTVDDEAQVSIVGSGDVEVAGAARCSVSRIGSGRVQCANTGKEVARR